MSADTNDLSLPPDLPPELADVFQAEAHDHLQAISAAATSLRHGAGAGDELVKLRRSVHTMKGAAGMVGFRAVTQLAHRMEDLLDLLCGGTAPSAAAVDLLCRSADLLNDLIEDTTGGRVLLAALAQVEEEYRVALLELGPGGAVAGFDLDREATEGSPTGRPDAARPVTPPQTAIGLIHKQSEPDAPSVASARPGAPRRALRVPMASLDDLAADAAELLVNRAALEQHLDRLSQQADEMALATRRLQRIASRLETEYEVLTLSGRAGRRHDVVGDPRFTSGGSRHGFDELELDRYTDFHLLSRELTETSSDLAAIGRQIAEAAGDFDGSVGRLGRLTRELQDELLRLRLVPLGTLAAKLERTIRVTAEQRGKSVELVLNGAELALDATFIDRIADPLLHLLRNAVDHGIETPPERVRQGKPECGRIAVAAVRQGNQILLTVSDDGRGLDYGRLRSTAVTLGLMSRDEAERAAEDVLGSLIFRAGFSTAAQVSEISGRGVGLDAVRAGVEEMKGRIGVESTPGRGTTFTVQVPLTLTIARALLVDAAGGTFAIPLAAVSEVHRIRWETVVDESAGEGTTGAHVEIAGRRFPALVLARALRVPPLQEPSARATALVVTVDRREVALLVDRIGDTRDVVVRSLGPQLARLHGVAGATVLGDGRIVLILDVDELVRRGADANAAALGRASIPSPVSTLEVMIADDSLTVRRALAALVRKAGWHPLEVRDGLEALETLQRTTRSPDAMLVDLEMPRLDGLELTAAVRGQEAFRTIPIVMITSRGGDKHRQTALSAGVTEYLVKPVQEEILISTIRRLVDAAGRTAA